MWKKGQRCEEADERGRKGEMVAETERKWLKFT